jgi:predicted transcriptional regulator
VLDSLRDVSMIYEGKGNLEAAETMLKEAGFTVSQVCCSRPSCFDLAARRNGNLILIKTQPDIDTYPADDSLELRQISGSVSAASLLISQKAREKPLEDDTVYSRYNVSAITLKTFENIVVGKTYPLIQAGPGGYYVEIDGGAVRRRRQELGLSAGEIAKMIGVSRRTLYGYERGMAKASVSAAYNLIYTLGIPVARSVNIFEKERKQRKCRIITTARRVIAKNKLLMRIFKRSSNYGFVSVQKAPFDFVITVPKDGMRIIGGVTAAKERDLDRRIDEIMSVSRVVKAHPFLVTEGREILNKDISCVPSDQLSRMKSVEDLIVNVI